MVGYSEVTVKKNVVSVKADIVRSLEISAVEVRSHDFH
jgi:hypothetical protein